MTPRVFSVLVLAAAACSRSGAANADAAPLASPFACGSARCGAEDYCVSVAGGLLGSDASFDCRPLPPGCVDAASCACLGRAGNDPSVQCNELGGHVTVTYVEPTIAVASHAAPEAGADGDVAAEPADAAPPAGSFSCGETICTPDQFCLSPPLSSRPLRKNRPPPRSSCQPLPPECHTCSCIAQGRKLNGTCTDVGGEVHVRMRSP